MTTVKTKKRLMYAVFVCMFIFGGIEYAVILPTLWLYLHNTYDAPEYMLGLVLSAYSLAAFFSSPIFGRISDRIGCTKQIFLVCATFELLGSFLYFIGMSQWLALGSRFIAGMGAAGEAIALAEVSRYTTEKERTGIISYLVATRQIALLIGPGLNLFLRIADFYIGPFQVNKYTAPGAFMVVLWAVLMIIILMLYTEPRKIYAQERLEQKQSSQQSKEEYAPSESAPVDNSGDRAERSQHNSGVQFSNSHNSKRDREGGKHNYSYRGKQRNTFKQSQDSDARETSRYLSSDEGIDAVYPPLTYDHSIQQQDVRGSENLGHQDGFRTPVAGEAVGNNHRSLLDNDMDGQRERSDTQYESNISDISQEYHDIQQLPQDLLHTENQTSTNSEHEGFGSSHEHIDSSVRLSTSLDLMLTAERLINSTQLQSSSKDNGVTGADASGLLFDDDHFGVSVDDFYTGIPGSHRRYGPDEKSSLTSVSLRSDQAPFLRSGTNDPYIERSTSVFDDPVAIEGKLGFFCNEYIRDEIIAIICLLFCAMFSQVCVETMVLPLSLKYLDFSELENSLLYCGCGVEIILVFIIMSRLSKRISDRAMMMFGACVLLSANIWLIIYLPKAPPHNRTHNIPSFAVAVFLDVLSLPFLLVCSTSLYSKLTRKQTQGLSQGLRRGIVGLGTIMAPMWGSSAANEPYVLLGVLVGIQSLSLVLCALSYKRFKVTPQQDSLSVSSPSSPTAGAAAGTSINSNPLDLPADAINGYGNRSPYQAGTAHSTPYGSIQRSIAGSSYRSVDSSSDEEKQHLLSNPIA